MTRPSLTPLVMRSFSADKPIAELARPLSALEVTRRSAWSAADFESGVSPQSRGGGAMIQRVNRKQRGRYAPATRLDHTEIRRLSADGLTPGQIGVKFGVRPGTISRVLRRYAEEGE